MSKLTKALTAAAGNAGGANLYVEDVFSTYLYAGNDNVAFDITNNIDLAGEGGLVWIKVRNATFDPNLFDTERGANNWLESSASLSQQTATNKVNAFNADGFSLGTHSGVNGGTDKDYVSWSFRKAEKFFDVVKWTGDGTASRQLSHGLNATPGLFIIKNLTASDPWIVWHKDLGDFAGAGKNLILNTTAATDTGNLVGTLAEQTSTYITVKKDVTKINNDGHEYIAYLFASDAGGYGEDEDENIIKCGSYTTDSGGESSDIDLGFEPQWIIAKQTNASGNGWFIMDSMRGFTVSSGGTKTLQANSSGAEGTHSFVIRNNGFRDAGVIAVNATVVYMAIRRPMKTPASGTEVFAMDTLGGTAPNPPGFNGLLVDWAWKRVRNTSDDWYSQSRLLGTRELKLNVADAESSAADAKFDYQDGWNNSNGTLSTQLSWMFKRATGFFDVVAYTGNATVRTVPHNLGVVPELMIVKKRNTVKAWYVYSAADSTKYLYLNNTNAFVTGSAEQIFGNDSTTVAPTSSVFSLGSQAAINGSGDTFINYLFASVAGVSKVGTYTGTGADLNVDCGFSAGARFILIKRTDSTGDWFLWDSLRGITAGNDPYLLLNTTAAEVTNTDYIDPLSSGFTVTSNASSTVNVSSGSYIFLAIA